MRQFIKRLFTTLCLITGTTEIASRFLGAAFFLPVLFVRRYAMMGGLDPQQFSSELRRAHSFADTAWCEHWDSLAASHLADAERVVRDIAGPLAAQEPTPLSSGNEAALALLRQRLAPLGPRVASLLTKDVSASPGQPSSAHQHQALMALRSLMKAITYYQVSAFPGDSPKRMEAYHQSRQLFDRLVAVCAPVLGISVERLSIQAGGDVVEGYLMLPQGNDALPLTLVTNGLEGTVQELVVPLLKYSNAGIAVFVMEMPGTYAYKRPMSDASEQTYHSVIEHLSAHPRINADRIGMVGVSFGAYWSTRIALTSKRLRCAVSNGGPNHRSFQMSGSFGAPEIIVRALRATTGATSLHDLGTKLRALSLRMRYRDIQIPLLLINGERDTLLSTQDSVDISVQAPKGLLKLYPDDDHCAMAHYDEWLEMAFEWLNGHLSDTRPASTEQERANASPAS